MSNPTEIGPIVQLVGAGVFAGGWGWSNHVQTLFYCYKANTRCCLVYDSILFIIISHLFLSIWVEYCWSYSGTQEMNKS